jgi:hypothetical protein
VLFWGFVEARCLRASVEASQGDAGSGSNGPLRVAKVANSVLQAVRSSFVAELNTRHVQVRSIAACWSVAALCDCPLTFTYLDVS